MTLPTFIDWTPRKTYNLEDKYDLVAFYVEVLSEANQIEMAGYLDKATLIRIWPSLGLPKRVVEAWEERYSELRQTEYPDTYRRQSPDERPPQRRWPNKYRVTTTTEVGPDINLDEEIVHLQDGRRLTESVATEIAENLK